MIDISEVYTIETWMIGEPMPKNRRNKKNNCSTVDIVDKEKLNSVLKSIPITAVKENVKKQSTMDYLKQLTEKIKSNPKPEPVSTSVPVTKSEPLGTSVPVITETDISKLTSLISDDIWAVLQRINVENTENREENVVVKPFSGSNISHVGAAPLTSHMERLPSHPHIQPPPSISHMAPAHSIPHLAPPLSVPHMAPTPVIPPLGQPPLISQTGLPSSCTYMGQSLSNSYSRPPPSIQFMAPVHSTPQMRPLSSHPRMGLPPSHPHMGPPPSNHHMGPLRSNPHIRPPPSISHMVPVLSNPHVTPVYSNPHMGPPPSNPNMGPPSNSHRRPPLSDLHKRPPPSNPHIPPHKHPHRASVPCMSSVLPIHHIIPVPLNPHLAPLPPNSNMASLSENPHMTSEPSISHIAAHLTFAQMSPSSSTSHMESVYSVPRIETTPLISHHTQVPPYMIPVTSFSHVVPVISTPAESGSSLLNVLKKVHSSENVHHRDSHVSSNMNVASTRAVAISNTSVNVDALKSEIQEITDAVCDPRLSKKRDACISQNGYQKQSIKQRGLSSNLNLTAIEKAVILCHYGLTTQPHESTTNISPTDYDEHASNKSPSKQKLAKEKQRSKKRPCTTQKEKSIESRLVLDDLTNLKDIVMDSDSEDNLNGKECAIICTYEILPESTWLTTDGDRKAQY